MKPTLLGALLIIAAVPIFSFIVLAEEDCYGCHLKQEKTSLRMPAEEVLLGAHANVSCAKCHEFDVQSTEEDSYRKDHERVPRELSSAQNIEACASRCHDFALPFRHGKSVRVDKESIGKSEEHVVFCTSCHETHATRKAADSSSWSHRDNVPETCAGRAGRECHASEGVAKEFKLLNAYPGYLASGHGRMRQLGYEKAPICTDCHAYEGSPHYRLVEKRNTESPIHRDNRERTCTQEDCHVGKGVKVGRGSMHGRSEFSLLGVPLERLIDSFYITMILVFVGGGVFFIALDFTGRLGGRR